MSVVVGEDTMFSPKGSEFIQGFPKGRRIGEVRDGTTNTILVVEKSEPFCWMDPTADIRYENAAQEIYMEKDCFYACMCDASVQSFSKFLPLNIFECLLKRNDNQPIVWDLPDGQFEDKPLSEQ